MKCSECGHEVFEHGNGGPNRYYCKHPEAVSGIGSWMICRTERYSTDLKIKTAPKWCPYKTA